MRHSGQTAYAAYWARWADVLPSLIRKCPSIGRNILYHLTASAAGSTTVPQCLADAEQAGAHCAGYGWNDRPVWADLAAGIRPPEPPENDGPLLGEWRHGWQYVASNPLQHTSFSDLRRSLALPSQRANATSTGKSRLYSCAGPFSGIWLLVCPTSDGLSFTNEQLQCAVKRRLGIAVTTDGPDPHGHLFLATTLGGRTHGRHKEMVAAWKQVLVEAEAGACRGWFNYT